MSALVLPLPAPRSAAHDTRYRALLGDAAWGRLPAAVRRRFSRKLAADQQVIYRGEVVEMSLSRAGYVLAQIGRLVGAPLPFTPGATGSAVVVVTEAPALGGQIWSRSYPRPGRFPQVIHSAKRFAGPTGLEEYLGLGLVMTLALGEDEGMLVFESRGFAIEVFGRRIGVPRWLSPGRCVIRHRNETDHRFSFTLTLDHPWLGRLAHQVAFFEDE